MNDSSGKRLGEVNNIFPFFYIFWVCGLLDFGCEKRYQCIKASQARHDDDQNSKKHAKKWITIGRPRGNLRKRGRMSIHESGMDGPCDKVVT